MDWAGILVGAAALVSAGAALVTTISKNREKKIETVCKDVSEMKEDIGVIKEACFFSLQGHVEQGVNGDVKKAHARLKETLFKE